MDAGMRVTAEVAVKAPDSVGKVEARARTCNDVAAPIVGRDYDQAALCKCEHPPQRRGCDQGKVGMNDRPRALPACRFKERCLSCTVEARSRRHALIDCEIAQAAGPVRDAGISSDDCHQPASICSCLGGACRDLFAEPGPCRCIESDGQPGLGDAERLDRNSGQQRLAHSSTPMTSFRLRPDGSGVHERFLPMFPGAVHVDRTEPDLRCVFERAVDVVNLESHVVQPFPMGVEESHQEIHRIGWIYRLDQLDLGGAG